jgi:hypothetical protein
MCASAATTTVYPTTTAERHIHLFGLRAAGSFRQDDAQIRKLRDNRNQLPKSRKW